MFVPDIFSVVLDHWLLWKGGFQCDHWIPKYEQHTHKTDKNEKLNVKQTEISGMTRYFINMHCKHYLYNIVFKSSHVMSTKLDAA